MRSASLRSCFTLLICLYAISTSIFGAPPDGTGAGDQTTETPERWINSYGHRELQGRFYRTKIEKGQPEADVVPIKLVVTTAENDGEGEQDDRFPGTILSRAVWYGVEIADDWRINGFYHS